MSQKSKRIMTKSFFKSESCEILLGDTRNILPELATNSIQSCITSPPYWGLRDYGIQSQIGSEMKVEDYIDNLVAIFGEVKRILKDNGTLWLNIGDSYTSGNRKWRQADKKNLAREMSYRPPNPDGLKDKELIGIPWRLVFALQADGWYLRSDIVWYKPNCQPESVKDRPTRAHEYVFLLTKSEKYFYDFEAIKEKTDINGGVRNRRSVWSINTEPFRGPHFAVFPKALVCPCILAGTKRGDLILDPFLGAGTVAACAQELGRRCLGVEIKKEYAELAKQRIKQGSLSLVYGYLDEKVQVA
jgi:site-specific DNA-methyltransferase (adenine-specific)/site-specific DNA-methyltransferase (cytosine-N4-specific)